MKPRLIVVSGLPGVGKTTVAQAVAARTGAVHLSIDAVEESVLACGLPSGWRVGVAAYEAVRVMAEMNLRLGHSVVVDAVNDSEEARQTWRTASTRTDAALDFVHLVTSDREEHHQRLRDRNRGFIHVGEPAWADVQRRRDDYAPWSDDVLELETSAHSVDDVADAVVALFTPR